jgi:HIRAN domain
MKKKVPRKLRVTVVGMQYRVTASTRQMISAHLEKGPLLCKLVREPSNPKDPNAIRVLISDKPYTGMFIGYLTRQVAEIIAPALDQGKVIVGPCVLLDLRVRDGEGDISIMLKTSVDFPAKRLNSL